ncbi:hypothetical protein B0H67DRAFT_46580 [Lasiosphaeris hirsuta]|uniref:C2H2-type domain-containing protein n=1 Tax=Lasiosphaeris hirsuta TaxID=260670 RepID=A0AA40BAH1_9PEZI|nr:hypothetical protein B0H67DRAFT_46580 [Lasiosphaeris hirsuta]
MASDNGPTATEAAFVTPAPHAAPGTHDAAFAVAVAADLSRSKSLKRVRETTPTPSPAPPLVDDDLSPAKIARLVGFAQQSHLPLTGAAVLENKRRRIRDDPRQSPPGTSPNPTHKALGDLASATDAAMSRPQDTRSASGPSVAVEAAAAAAARAFGTVHIPADPSAELHHGSPQSAVSAGTGASLEDGEGQVVHSPGQMDVDRNDQRMYAPQPEAQMEDKSSLSYPGVIGATMPAPAPPQRGMSMPMPSSQNSALAPQSPNSKKHKCQYCETEFTRHHNLKSHLLTHSQEKPYICQECNMRFRRLHDLKRHSKLHTGEKPHICPKCDRKFARGDALARHSKGAGGCAGRRPSMGSFAGDEDYEGNSADADDSAMTGVLYGGSPEVITEDERRRLSAPSIKAQHVVGQPGQDGFAVHSNTYPPTSARSAGGLYPPNVDRGSTGSATSPSVPNHTPHTSISSQSMPLSAGSSSMYSQSGMTESPKPLSPSGAQTNQAGQKRGALNQQQQQQQPASMLSLPTHGMSPAAKQAWLSQYPPADGNYPEGNAAAPSPSGRGRGRGSSGAAAQRQVSNGTGPSENNIFSGADQGLLNYINSLSTEVTKLKADADARKKTEAELVEKVTAHEQHISLLASELASLRQQLPGANEEVAGQE